MQNLRIEDFQFDRHYVHLAPLVVDFYRDVNGEDYTVMEPLRTASGFIAVRKVELKLQALILEGIFCKVAVVEDALVGFLWYRPWYGNVAVFIDAFYVPRKYRGAAVGQMLINSLSHPYNGGVFDIYATIHKDAPPKEMLAVFHGWEEVRKVNDRDLVLIRGRWDLATQKAPEKEEVKNAHALAAVS